MILVLNEWVFHDLLGDNGPDAFRQTAAFMARLDDSDDKVVMPTEDRWRGKALQLETVSDFVRREVCQLFLGLFYDSDRTIRLRTGDIPRETQGAYSWAPRKDVYLIEAYVASNADLLVTTDETLFDKVSEQGQFACKMRDDFLAGHGLSS